MNQAVSAPPHVQASHGAQRPASPLPQPGGFSLVEALIVLLVLSSGLLAAGRLLVQTMSSLSLARSKGVLAVVAESKLESLADLYSRDPDSADLQDGVHGPEMVEIRNPRSGKVLHRISVSWLVSPLADPRPGKHLRGKILTVTASPAADGTAVHYVPGQNKIFSLTSVLTPRLLI